MKILTREQAVVGEKEPHTLFPSQSQNPRSEDEKEIETPEKLGGIPEKNGVASGILGFSPKYSMF